MKKITFAYLALSARNQDGSKSKIQLQCQSRRRVVDVIVPGGEDDIDDTIEDVTIVNSGTSVKDSDTKGNVIDSAAAKDTDDKPNLGELIMKDSAVSLCVCV